MQPKLQKILEIYKRPRVLIMAALGFASGLPILLVFSSLSAWLKEADISKASIGFASWVGLAYGFKYVWSPLVDKLSIPLLTKHLGRRRAWMILAQIGIIIGILGMAHTDPKYNLSIMIGFAVLLAFCSATQDIVIDAFRIDTGKTEEQASMAALYVYGYRVAMLLAGGGLLWLADTGTNVYDYTAWRNAYSYMALAMIPALVTVLFLQEPKVPLTKYAGMGEWLQQAFVEPFKDFYVRYGKSLFYLAVVILTFRMSDILMSVMANPFYIEMGFTKTEIASAVKIFGFAMTLTGLAVGGIIMPVLGLRNTMILACILSSGTNVLFSILAGFGNDITFLTFVISADNLSAGIATSSFIAYLSSLINKEFSATQYALLSSIIIIIPKFLAGFSGVMVENFGYAMFFTGTALVGIPTVLFIYLADKKMKQL